MVVRSMRFVAAVVVLVVCVHAGLWALLREQTAAPDFDGQLASVSYAPYATSGNPEEGYRPTPTQIRADLKVIAPFARAIRTYSSTAGGELVPKIADELGLRVTVGAWLDGNPRRNEVELRTALDLARRYHNVNGLVIGNETVYRGETVLVGDDGLSPEELNQLGQTSDPVKLRKV